MESICAGLNVLELGSGSIAASIAGMVLADAGARVIKVEPPEGDRLRTRRSQRLPRVEPRQGERRRRPAHADGPGSGCASWPRDADVVIEGFAPGTTDGWGSAPTRCGPPTRRSSTARSPASARPARTPASRATTRWSPRRPGCSRAAAFGHRDGPIMFPGAVGELRRRRCRRSPASSARCSCASRPGGGRRSTPPWSPGSTRSTTSSRTIVAADGQAGRGADGRRPRRDRGQPLRRAAWPPRTAASSRPRRCCPTRARRCARSPASATCSTSPVRRLPDVRHRRGRPGVGGPAAGRRSAQQDLAEWLPLLEASPDIAFEVAVTSEEGLDHPQIVHNGDVVTVDDPERRAGAAGRPDRPLLATRRSSSTRSAPALGEQRRRRSRRARRPPAAARRRPTPSPA